MLAILGDNHFVTAVLKLVSGECANIFLIVGKENPQRADDGCRFALSTGRVRGFVQTEEDTPAPALLPAEGETRSAKPFSGSVTHPILPPHRSTVMRQK